VWHRLPRRIRRFNVAVGLTAGVFLFVSVPLPVLVVATQGYAARTGRPSAFGAVLERAMALDAARVLLWVLFFLPFAALVALTAEALLHGRRLVRTLGPSLPDPEAAARALYTPSWRRGFWERPPFDSLLLPEPRSSPREGPAPRLPPGPGTESATVTRPGDAAPRER
jgi:hypothetical protein